MAGYTRLAIPHYLIADLGPQAVRTNQSLGIENATFPGVCADAITAVVEPVQALTGMNEDPAGLLSCF